MVTSLEAIFLKLQRYDFGGRSGRRTVPRLSPRERRRALIFRYGALGSLALVLLGLLHLSKTSSPPEVAFSASDSAVALGISPTLDPSESASPYSAIPAAAEGIRLGTPGLDLHSPFLHYPAPDTFQVEGRSLAVEYAADSLIQTRIGVYLQRYLPDAAVVMACDLKTGHVLGVGERADSTITMAPRLAFKSGFPAASLVKILTATAALEIRGKDPLDSIPQPGSYYTLYRRQLKVGSHEQTPKVTLQEAFSKSANPAFGVLGLSMGPRTLQKTALDLGFNRPFACVRPSHFQAPDSGYALAETSCGFTDRTTLSPFHALAIARGVGDDGRVRYGTFAKTVTDLDGRKDLEIRPDAGRTFVTRPNLAKLQTLMEATVRSGTARKGFHQVMRASHLQKLDVGGKTGSLDGLEPSSSGEAGVQTATADAPASKGRYDWFIGYVRFKDDPSRGMALSIMLVHGEYARIRSTVFAALLVRDWLAAEEKADRQRKAAATAVTGARPAAGPLTLAGNP